MSSLIEKIKSISRIKILAVVLIIIGVGIMIFRGLGMFSFYQEVRYAELNNFKAGNLSTGLLRPWMTIRYISVAYAVPQKYLFDELMFTPNKENSMISLKRLNSQMNLGLENNKPVILKLVTNVINKYRENPVVTGLIEQKVTDWMSIQYIANSTGIPSETIFSELGIPKDGNAYMPLGYLSDVVNFSGGPKSLVTAVQKIVDSQPKKP
ncbi:MAG: hypothetical protein WCP19_06630 [Chloroflexota bacterium]